MLILSRRVYDGGSIPDASKHIEDAINDNGLPVNEYGIVRGRFKITVEWEDDE